MSAHSKNINLDKVATPTLGLVKFSVKTSYYMSCKQLVCNLVAAKKIVQVEQAQVLQLSVNNVCFHKYTLSVSLFLTF